MTGPRTLVLDNNDSFTFNLVQYLAELGADPVVAVAGVDSLPDPNRFDLVVISPGPGTPEAAGEARNLLEETAGIRPVLGVCLGHQVIVSGFGGVVGPAPEPRHGKVSEVRHDGKGVFAGLADPFPATRYHSLITTSVGPELEECAWSEDGVIQGVRHRSLPIHGVQFHPESVMTGEGKRLLGNFLAVSRY